MPPKSEITSKIGQILLPTIVSALIAAGVAWGASQRQRGVETTELQTLKSEVEKLRERQGRCLTREDMKQFVDDTRDRIKDIKDIMKETRELKQ